MKPKLITKDEIKLIGIEARTTNQQEADPATAKIPGLWQKFFMEGIAEKILHQIDPDTRFGAYINYDSDFTGIYSLIAAVKVSSLADIPDGMTGLTIPSARYLVFTVEGEMPIALIEAWGFIWNHFSNGSDYERAYTADFELYDTNDATKADIYIAIK
ncbi:GyrI-like domain-containing protein [Chloroflexota bacterium]